MPHINLLYPFVSHEELLSAAEEIAKRLQACSPFDVSISSFSSFTHGRGKRVCWLKPEPSPEDAFQKIYNELRAIFEGDGFKLKKLTPHMSCGQIYGRDAANAFLSEQEKLWKETLGDDVTFSVSDLCVLKRDGKEDPYSVVYRIPIGSPPGMQPGVPLKVHEPYSHLDWGEVKEKEK